MVEKIPPKTLGNPFNRPELTVNGSPSPAIRVKKPGVPMICLEAKSIVLVIQNLSGEY